MASVTYTPVFTGDGRIDTGLDGYVHQDTGHERRAVERFESLGGNIASLIRDLASDPLLTHLRHDFETSSRRFQYQVVERACRQLFREWGRGSSVVTGEQIGKVLTAWATLEAVSRTIDDSGDPKLTLKRRRKRIPPALVALKRDIRGSSKRPFFSPSSFIQAIRKHYLPEVARLINLHLLPLRPELAARFKARLPRAWAELPRADQDREAQRQLSQDLNETIVLLIQALYPYWGREIGVAHVREALKNGRRRK